MRLRIRNWVKLSHLFVTLAMVTTLILPITGLNLQISNAATTGAPSAPTSVTATAGPGSIGLAWSSPTDNGGQTISGFIVEYSTSGTAGTWIDVPNSLVGSSTSFTINGLSGNTAYYTRVAAKHSSGASVGAFGYPWTKIYSTSTPTRTNANGSITYDSGFGLNPGNPGVVNAASTAFTRVRYEMKSTYASTSGVAAKIVDADFYKSLSNKQTYGGVGLNLDTISNLRIPAPDGASSQFIIQGDVSDLTVHSNVSNTADTNVLTVAKGFGFNGRLEFFPWNYGSTAVAGLTNRSTEYDDNDTASTSSSGGSYGSFQLHNVTTGNLQTVFAWNNHGNTSAYEIGFGNSEGTNSDWTFTNTGTTRSAFSLGIYANIPVTTGLSPALTPTFGTPTFTTSNYTIPISSYDSNYTWTCTATNSSTPCSISNAGVVTVTPTSGLSAAVTVYANRTNYEQGSATASAYYAGCNKTTTSSNGYTYEAIKTAGLTCTWSVPSNVKSIDYLVVAGGGGGGSRHNGGGGAGGYIKNSGVSTEKVPTINVYVGAGGSGKSGSYQALPGDNGSDSSISKNSGSGTFATQVAKGGAGGGVTFVNGTAFGSSGGLSNFASSNNLATATAGQGFQGNYGGYDPLSGTNAWFGGGGGGGSAQGGLGTRGGGGTGGNGVTWISDFNSTIASNLGLADTSGYFAGGGGGGIGRNTGATASGGSGGLGGGGKGGNALTGSTTGVADATTQGTSGIANTGGGGGGSGLDQACNSCDPKAGNGGSGVVIIRYISSISNPTFSTPISTASGYTVNVTNYDSNLTYSVSSSAGTATKGTPSGSTLPVTIGGLSAGVSSTLSVSAQANGITGTGSVTGNAINTALTPTFGNVTYSADGKYTIQITNYDSSFGWAYSGGSTTPTAGAATGSIIPITVTPTAGSNAALTVTTSKSNYANGTASSTSFYGGCIVTTTTSGNYTIETISNLGTCNWSTPSTVSKVNVLVVAGGGGGGDSAVGAAAGRGGAGGLFAKNNVPISGDVQINVGAGGAGAVGSTTQASSGGNSWFGTLKVGGGGGANSTQYTTARAGAGVGGADYVSGGNGGGGAPAGRSTGTTGGLGGGYAASGVTFLGNTYTGFAGVDGTAGSDGGSGGAGGSITLANRTSLISGSSVVYAKPGTYLIWDYSALTNPDNPQTYGSGGSANYTYNSQPEPAGYTTGGSGKQGIVIVSYISSGLTPTFDTPVKTATGFTVNVTNYDPNFTFTPTTSVGSISAGAASGSTLPLTVSGLTAGQAATITVATLGNGLSGSTSLSSNSSKSAQTVSFTSTAPTSATVGGATYIVTGSATSLLTPTITIDSSAALICSINGSNVVTFLTVGSCKVNINQAGNDAYLPATQIQQSFAVSKGAQTITFAALAGKNYGDAPFTVSATSTSGLPVVFTSATAAVCTVSGTTVTIANTGTCTLNANQSGDSNYNSATQVAQSFTVSALAALTPTFSTPTFISGKWNIDVTNYDNNVAITWGYSSSNGSVDSSAAAVGSIKRLVITPTSNTAATLTVTTSRTGYSPGTATTSAFYGGCNVSAITSASNPYSIYKFLNTGTCSWVVPSNATKADILTVGGGGAGGTRAGGGGGAGGYLYFAGQVVTPNQIVTITVGAGGVPVLTDSAGNGGNSSFGTLTTAIGGGGGGGALTTGNTARAGKDGGSGGGAAGNSNLSGSTYGVGTVGQGKDGAPVYYSAADSYQWIGGGGGGSSSTGFMGTHPNTSGNASTWVGGKGGFGTSNSITGTSVCYATGGGGGIYSTWTGGAAGDCAGGVSNPNGGAGTAGSSTPATPTANTGAGGGASGYSNSSDAIGGAGASGVVIFRYITSALTPTFDSPVQSSTGFTVNINNYDSNFTFTATVSAGSISVGTAVGSILPLTITGLTSGQTVTVNVSTAGGGYNGTGTLTSSATKSSQTITFGTVSSKSVLLGSFSLAATTNSSLAITYASTTASVCTVSGSTVTLVATGSCTITANQAGDAAYLAAVQVSQTFSVTAATITFNSNYGTATTTTQTVSAPGSFSLTANTFTRSNYSFAGWNTIALGGGTAYTNSASVTLTGDTTLYAQWTGLTYSISYNNANTGSGGGLSGGNAPATQTGSAVASVTLTLNTLSISGYAFAGWATSNGSTSVVYTNGAAVPISANTTLNLYPVWTGVGYTVTYKAGTGGTGTDLTQTFTYPASITLKDATAALTKTGYAISAWSITDGGTAAYQLSDAYASAANLTLYPVWSAKSFTVTYMAGTNGTGLDITQSWTYPGPVALKSAALASTISRTNYSISGWSTTDGGAQAYALSANYSAAADLILYPVWSATTFTITYSAATADSGSAATASASYTSGATGLTLSLVGSMVKTGYTFAGWSTTSGGSANVTSPYTTSADVNLYAAWTINSYVVTFNSQSGSAVSNGSFTYGGSVEAPTSPTRTGYTLDGWFAASTGGAPLVFPYSPGGTTPITLYAQWSPIAYTVTYALNGGTGTAPTESTKTIGATFNVAGIGSVLKAGYTFAGWNDGTTTYQEGTNNYTVGSANVVLTAQWNLAVYTITYSNNSGSGSASRTTENYTYGSAAINLPTVGTMARTGYSFGGWSTSTSGSAISGAYTPAASITLYAVWNANTYTITYNMNGGSGTGPVAGSYTTAGATVTLPGVGSMVKTGYTFTGWATSSTGAVISSTGYTTTSNSTLYAIWLIKTIQVTYNAGLAGGATPSPALTLFPTSISGTFGSTITISSSIDAFANTNNYAFAGWSDGTTTYNKGDTYRLGESDVTFTAQWVAIYAVRYSTAGGTLAAGTLNYDAECVAEAVDHKCLNAQVITANIDPIRAGFTFSGWKDQSGNTISSASSGWTISTTSYLAFATWSPIAYHVTYDSNGGTTAPTETDKFIGELVTVGAAPTRTGYTFGGWVSGGVTYGAGTTLQVGAANVAFTAAWSAINYSVSYDLNGGTSTVPASEVKIYLDSVNVAAAPTRAGYTFTNWNNGSGTTAAGATYAMPASDVVFTAQWTAIPYAVTYNSDGGSAAPAGLTAKHVGDTFVVGAAVTLAGRNFLGWNDTVNTYLPGQTYTIQTADVVLKAVWSGQLYTVTYAANGGTGSVPLEPDHLGADTVTVETGSGLTRAGYTFAGWTYNSVTYQDGNTFTMPSGPVTLTAKWTANSITFTFEPNFGTGSSYTQSATADTNTNLTSNTFARTNYTFGGWTEHSDGTGNFYANSSSVNFLTNTTLYAKWIPAFVVTFNSDGGSTVSSLTYTGTALAKPADPTKTGYSFVGWSNGSSTVSWSYSPTAPITLIAEWSAGTYTITFNKNDGGATTATQSIVAGVSTALNTGVFTRANFAFAGWAESASGGVVFADGANITVLASKSLYAIWSESAYVVTYSPGERANTPRASDTYVLRGAALRLPVPSRQGFTFEGWYDASTGGNKVGDADTEFTPAATRTLHGRWTQTSLYGLSGSLSPIGNFTAQNVGDLALSVTNAGFGVSITIPNNAVPTGTVISAQAVGDLARARAKIPGTNNFALSVVVSWLAPDGSVPDTPNDKKITMTITNPAIKAGSIIYSILGNTVTALGTATVDGSATFQLQTDPEIVIAATVPGAPTSVTATTSASQSASVSWSAPVSNGGTAITGYKVTSSGGQVCSTSGATPATSCTVTGLTNGTAYTFTVTASNAEGTSAASNASASVTPQGGSGISVSTAMTGTYGTAQTITATLTGTDGAVNFKVGGVSIAGCSSVTSTSLTATCSWTPAAADSAASITAVLTPSSGAFTSATSSAVVVNVGTRAITVKAADKSAAYTGSAVSVTNSYSVTSGTLVGSDAIGSMSYAFSTLNPTNAGTYTITPSAVVMSTGSTSNYTFTYTTGTLTISTNALVLSFGTAPSGVVLGAGTHSVSATTSPTGIGSVTYASTTTTVCTVDSITGAVTVLTSGTCTVTANNTGDANHAAAAQDTQTFSVAPIVITFDSNGGGASSTTQNLTSLSATALTSNAFVRSGYTFAGWNTVAGGTGTAYANSANMTPTVSLTLFAQWTAQQSSGGSGNTVPVAPEPVEPPTPPTKPVTPPVVPVEPVKPPVVEVPSTPITTAADGSSTVDYTTKETLTLIDGKSVVETIKVVDLTKVVTQSQGVQLQLQALNSASKSTPVDADMKLTLEHEGTATVAGAGFKTETLVKAWLFSEPIYLGEFKVDASGAFVADLQILNTLPVGNHILQINGLTPDSKLFSQSIPVTVKAKDVVTPVDPTPPPKPVDPTPTEPTVKPSVAKYAYTLWFKNGSNYVNSALKKTVKEFAPRVKSTKVVTCVAYIVPVKGKSSYKLELSRAKNACIAISKLYKTKKKMIYKTEFIKNAKGKAKAPSKSRSARVDIFVG